MVITANISPCTNIEVGRDLASITTPHKPIITVAETLDNKLTKDIAVALTLLSRPVWISSSVELIASSDPSKIKTSAGRVVKTLVNKLLIIQDMVTTLSHKVVFL